MKYPFPQDVQQLVAERLASGQYSTEDDVLREALFALAEQEEDLQAVREAIAEWESGDEGIPVDEAFEAIRRANSIKRDA